MDWYYKFLNWFKDKYGYDIWGKRFEMEGGKSSAGEMLFIIIPLAIIYITFDDEINSIFNSIKTFILGYF